MTARSTLSVYLHEIISPSDTIIFLALKSDTGLSLGDGLFIMVESNCNTPCKLIDNLFCLYYTEVSH